MVGWRCGGVECDVMGVVWWGGGGVVCSVMGVVWWGGGGVEVWWCDGCGMVGWRWVV